MNVWTIPLFKLSCRFGPIVTASLRTRQFDGAPAPPLSSLCLLSVVCLASCLFVFARRAKRPRFWRTERTEELRLSLSALSGEGTVGEKKQDVVEPEPNNRRAQ